MEERGKKKNSHVQGREGKEGERLQRKEEVWKMSGGIKREKRGEVVGRWGGKESSGMENEGRKNIGEGSL